MRTALVACWFSVTAIAPSAARAQGFFTQPEIDYWNEAKAKRAAEAPERPSRPLDAGEFRWEDYDDPTTDVFWDDGGNYVPPRPLRVAAADPTPANVAKYLHWQRRKLEVITSLNQEVAKQIGEEPSTPQPSVLPKPASIVPQQAPAMRQAGPPIDWNRVELVFFYSSECPHCQASLGTVNALQALGAKVIPVQMDWRQRPPLLPGSVHYTAEIAKEQPVDGVPTWVAAYRGDRLTMQGEMTVESIETALKQHAAQTQPQHVSGE